ncbi:MFS transporter [Pseudonocardia humida]|uniref:MFS transporter n=1 Tax=Pseudonocardia humida TaxID=2800819 RepID=UPI0027E307A4|nr:MFS transporter [Pseudonocardia humida]
MILVLASCGLAVSLMQTLVVPLLPQFPRLLDTSPATVAWLVTATLVAGAVCAPLLGRLGDMYGRKRMLVLALAVVTAGSVLGAVAPGVEVLIVARVLQGASLGVVPLGISIMRGVLPEGRVGSGVALMSSSLGIGGAIGLPITGLVAEHLGWRWLFAGAAVLCAVLLALVQRMVAESPERTGGRFDLLGALGLGAALVSLLLAISKGSEWGWSSPRVLGLLAAAVVLFALWGRLELRVRAPLVDLRVSARPAVLWTNVASVLIGFSMFAGFLLTTQVLQAPTSTGYGQGLSLIAAGMVLLPVGAVMVVFSPISARISDRRGARTTLLIGAVILTAGNLWQATIPPTVPLIMAATTVTSIGAALAYSAIPMLIMDAVPSSETAAANSLNSLMRMLGTSSCSAFTAAVASGMIMQVDGHAVPTGGAYTVVYLAAAGAGLAAVLIMAALPRLVRGRRSAAVVTPAAASV